MYGACHCLYFSFFSSILLLLHHPSEGTSINITKSFRYDINMYNCMKILSSYCLSSPFTYFSILEGFVVENRMHLQITSFWKSFWCYMVSAIIHNILSNACDYFIVFICGNIDLFSNIWCMLVDGLPYDCYCSLFLNLDLHLLDLLDLFLRSWMDTIWI